MRLLHSPDTKVRKLQVFPQRFVLGLIVTVTSYRRKNARRQRLFCPPLLTP